MSLIRRHIDEHGTGETRVTDAATGGEKNTKRARPELIPAYATWRVAEVYGVGASKYAPDNWRKSYAWSLSIGAAERHLLLIKSGEDIDPEDGLLHAAKVVFHMNALMEFAQTHPEKDDRTKPASVPAFPPVQQLNDHYAAQADKRGH